MIGTVIASLGMIGIFLIVLGTVFTIISVILGYIFYLIN
jgi:hypothetical protein